MARASAHTRINFQVSGFSLARRALMLHKFSIYLCIGGAQVLVAAAPPAGPERHTYYVINPRPGGSGARGGQAVARAPPPPAPAWAAAGLSVLAGFPRPRASRPLTTHGTGLRVLPPPVAPRPASTSHLRVQLRVEIDP